MEKMVKMMTTLLKMDMVAIVRPGDCHRDRAVPTELLVTLECMMLCDQQHWLNLKNLKLKSYLDLKMRMKEKKTHTWKTTRRSTLETLPLSTNLLFYMEYLFDEKTWLER